MKFDKIGHNASENSCNFLDLLISIKKSKISTDLFRKETSKPSALLPSSAHPGHVSPNIVYSMAFRLLRICSDQNLFEHRLSELATDFLVPRDYKVAVIQASFNKVRHLVKDDYKAGREKALEKIDREDKETERVIVPIDYNPRYPSISGVFRKHHKAMLKKNPELTEPFPDPPMAALRQGPNLRRRLCRARLYPIPKGGTCGGATLRTS